MTPNINPSAGKVASAISLSFLHVVEFDLDIDQPAFDD